MDRNIIDTSTSVTVGLASLKVSKTKTPRKGRDNQLYGSIDNARLVAGGIILDDHHEKVLMISSSKHQDKWIIPKGGIELDEADNFGKTALREVWEEAGAIVTIIKKLPVIKDHRIGSTEPLDFPLCEFHFYQMKLLQLDIQWPESDHRLRRWCTYQEAKHELLKSKRPELLQALNDSDILKGDLEILEYDKNNHLTDAQLDNDHEYEHI
jgi:diphosphoinositol-polyphosphate diphosphatase